MRGGRAAVGGTQESKWQWWGKERDANPDPHVISYSVQNWFWIAFVPFQEAALPGDKADDCTGCALGALRFFTLPAP